jgi:hypothetical protein
MGKELDDPRAEVESVRRRHAQEGGRHSAASALQDRNSPRSRGPDSIVIALVPELPECHRFRSI